MPTPSPALSKAREGRLPPPGLRRRGSPQPEETGITPASKPPSDVQPCAWPPCARPLCAWPGCSPALEGGRQEQANVAPEAAATPPRAAVTASVVTCTPRLTSKGHRPPAHSRVLTEHLVIPVNVASALRPGPRFCPAHDGLPVTSPAAHPHPCSPHPRSAPAGEPDGPGEGVRPSRASRGGPTSRHLAPSETRCPRFQTTARKRGVPWCPDTQLRWAGVRRAPQSSFCAWTGALDTPGQYS